MSKKSKKPDDLVAVTDLQKRLKMPGRENHIARSALDKLINKKLKTRIKPGLGQGAKAYIPAEIAAWVEDYFQAKHSK